MTTQCLPPFPSTNIPGHCTKSSPPRNPVLTKASEILPSYFCWKSSRMLFCPFVPFQDSSTATPRLQWCQLPAKQRCCPSWCLARVSLPSLCHSHVPMDIRNHAVGVLTGLLEMIELFCCNLHISDGLSLSGENMKRNPVPLMLWPWLYYSSPQYKPACTRNATCCIGDARKGHKPRWTHSRCLRRCLGTV